LIKAEVPFPRGDLPPIRDHEKRECVLDSWIEILRAKVARAARLYAWDIGRFESCGLISLADGWLDLIVIDHEGGEERRGNLSRFKCIRIG
jgi:hypothetical protein